MRYVRMLGLLAVAAASMMAFAGGASAEVATSPAGTVYTGPLHATSVGHVILHSPSGVTIECNSTVAGKITGHGSKHTPVSGPIETLDFTGCTNNWTATPLKLGTLSVTKENGVNIVRGTGQEVTVFQHGSGLHCIYSTNNTVLGTLDEGSPAELTISATIPRTGGNSGIFCGSTGTWTGTYKVNIPTSLFIDTT